MIRPILLLAALTASGFSAEKLNVLFIAVDDLRPELNCYGNKDIHSPNIDALAARGTLFERTYCQVAVCGASRASLMTGLRPQSTRCWNFKTPMREMNPDALSMPQHFKKHGYTTLSIGKIYHASNDDFPQGWSEKPLRGMGAQYASPAGIAEAKKASRIQRATGVRTGGPSIENGGEVSDDAYNDGMTAKTAIERLKKIAATDKPFFLAVGFTKPHLPFNAPAKYWDLYDRSKIKVPSRDKVIDGLSYDGSGWGELKNYSDIALKTKKLDDAKTRELIHGYRASVSYMDAQVGRVINALETSGLVQNTIIVLWGDHGYYLGDYGEWCKHTTYEVAAKVPLIIASPQLKGGQRTSALTELVDLFPTLCDLSGVPVPTPLHGVSLKPVIQDPEIKWKEGVFSQYFKNKPKVGKVLGTSIRTDRYRYTEWRKKDHNGSLEDITLIDLEADPKATKNVAADPVHKEFLKRLGELAKKSGTGIKP
ncbi:MAG: sulfatase [Verrucomicrobiales bacterium]|jgi:iduronate 2-sulfatase|tara:strand:- start:419 stop:1861 length:1443 start_codon:yes stop_codon:yes gene_type:complete